MAGFKSHQIDPTVHRMGYFVPKDRKLKYPVGAKPTLAESTRQLSETEFYQYFEKNKEEYEIREELDKMIHADEDPRNIVKTINEKLGYEMFYEEEGEVKRFFDYERQESKEAKSERLSKNKPRPRLPWAFELTYAEFGKRYNHKGKKKGWRRYKYLTTCCTRLPLAYPGNEFFYLRILMSRHKGMKHVDELLLGPDGLPQPNFKMSCLAWGYIYDSTEYFTAMHEANLLGLYGKKLLGFYCSILKEGDATNIRELWDGKGLKEISDRRPLVDVEKQYPKGFKDKMMIIPKNVSDVYGHNYEFYTDEIKHAVEQLTLKELSKMLEEEGVEYPEELPPLEPGLVHQLTKEYIRAHRSDPNKCEREFNKNYASTYIQCLNTFLSTSIVLFK